MPTLVRRVQDVVSGIANYVVGTVVRCHKWSKKHPGQFRLLTALILTYLWFNYDHVLWRNLGPYGHVAQAHAYRLCAWVNSVVFPGTWIRFFIHAALIAVGVVAAKQASARLSVLADDRAQRKLAQKNADKEAAVRRKMQYQLQLQAQQAEEERRIREEAAAQRRVEEAAEAARTAAEQQDKHAQAVGGLQAQTARAAQAVTAQRASTAAAGATTAASGPTTDHTALQRQRYDALQRSADAAAAATAAAAAAAAAARGAAVAVSAAGAAGSSAVGGSGGMIPLAAAREAEARQREWLEAQGGGSMEAVERAAREAERVAQDAEYQEALTADQKRAAARAAAAAEAARKEEERKAKARQLQELAALKVSLREALASEPPEGASDTDGGESSSVVVVRVRLPDGSTNTRRFARDVPMSDLYDWVQSVEAMPLWAPGTWRLVTSFPKSVAGREASLAEVLPVGRSLALYVELADS